MHKIIVVGVAGTLLLCGCSSDDGGTGASESTPTTDAPLTLPSASATAPATGSADAASTAPAKINDRGNVVQATGQQAGVRGPDGSQAVVFTVDTVVVDQPCAGEVPPATNGHYLGVQVRVTTGDVDSLGGGWSMSAADFGMLETAGGIRFDLASQGAADCLQGFEEFPTTPLGPDQEYVGTVVLDAPATSGTLVFSPPSAQGNGWEWEF